MYCVISGGDPPKIPKNSINDMVKNILENYSEIQLSTIDVHTTRIVYKCWSHTDVPKNAIQKLHENKKTHLKTSFRSPKMSLQSLMSLGRKRHLPITIPTLVTDVKTITTRSN